jgi:hypothetical protein
MCILTKNQRTRNGGNAVDTITFTAKKKLTEILEYIYLCDAMNSTPNE